MDHSWEPFASEKLLTIRYPSLTATKIDGHVVDSICVKNCKVLVPGLGSDTLAAKMIKGHAQTHRPKRNLLEVIPCPSLCKIREFIDEQSSKSKTTHRNYVEGKTFMACETTHLAFQDASDAILTSQNPILAVTRHATPCPSMSVTSSLQPQQL